jgi:hypothetical protein
VTKLVGLQAKLHFGEYHVSNGLLESPILHATKVDGVVRVNSNKIERTVIGMILLFNSFVVLVVVYFGVVEVSGELSGAPTIKSYHMISVVCHVRPKERIVNLVPVDARIVDTVRILQCLSV